LAATLFIQGLAGLVARSVGPGNRIEYSGACFAPPILEDIEFEVDPKSEISPGEDRSLSGRRGIELPESETTLTE
jgi:hypothetical protein